MLAEKTQMPLSPSKERARKKQQETRDEQAAKGGEKLRGPRYEGQFFKTKMCMFWAKGMCTRGTECKYAHGDVELNSMPNLTRTSLCKELLTTGQCSRQVCPFAHSFEDLRATQKFYKTSMCSFYRVGSCLLGNECRHAHHPSELRAMPPEEIETAATTDNLEDNRGRGQPGRRPGAGSAPGNGSRSTKRWKDIEDDDGLDELGELPAWERITTSPATFGTQMPSLMPYTIRGGSGMSTGSRDFGGTMCRGDFGPTGSRDFGSCTTGTSWTTRGVSGSSEEDDFDNDLPDMWTRMRTMPAPCMAPPAALLQGGALSLMPQAAAALPTGGYSNTGDPTKPVMMVPCMLVPVPVQQQPVQQQPQQQQQQQLQQQSLQHRLTNKQRNAGARAAAARYLERGGGHPGIVGVASNQGPGIRNVGSLAVGSTFSAGASSLDLETTKALCNQLEAKILENAMPEVYED